MYTGHIAHIRQYTKCNDTCNSLFREALSAADLTSEGGKLNVV